MTEYEIIDAICDSVNPILFFTALGVGVLALVKKNFKKALVAFLMLFSGLLLTYSVLFVDTKLKIWAALGYDYSTHTAFAIATCLAISTEKHSYKWLIGVFFTYAATMIYQGYHSTIDIATTTLVIGTPLILVRKYCGSRLRLVPDTDGGHGTSAASP